MVVNRPSDRPDAPPLPPLTVVGRQQRWWFAPLLIVLLAGVLRFVVLDRPGIWGDEASTFGRVNGSNGQLIERLKSDGFMPLHYQLYFLLAQVVKLTPGWMRVWPALAGTAMVPAVYFLARQLVSRRVALLAMLLTATSAFQLYYSRDAKMYAGQWLFVTLSMGCFFWWLTPEQIERHRRRVRFWLWVFCSVAAIGIHSPSLLVIGLQPLLFFVLPGKTWWRGVAVVLGVAAFAAVPAIYYSTYNDWIEKSQDNWNTSMLQWVKYYNEGRDLPKLLRFTGTAYGFGWEWPDKPTERGLVTPWVMGLFQAASGMLLLVLALGVIPWRGMWGRITKKSEVKLEGSPRELSLARLVFVFGCWVAVPAAILYSISMDDPTAPWWAFSEVARSGGKALVSIPGLVAMGIGLWLLAGVALSIRKKGEWGTVFLAAAVVFGLCCAVYAGIMFKRWHPGALHGWKLAWPPWTDVKFEAWTRPEYGKMLWMPRYLGVVYPAVAIVAAALLMRLPVGIRHLAIVGLVAINLGNYGARLWISPEPPIQRVVDDLWADSQAQKKGETGGPPIVFHGGGRWGSGYEPGTSNLTSVVGRYHVAVKAGVPVDPAEFRVGLSSIVERYLISRANLRPPAVRTELAKRPGVNEAIYWSRGDTGPTTRGSAPSALAASLGRQWELVASDFYQSYDHWTWARRGTLARTLYRKLEGVEPEPAPPAARQAPRGGTRATTRAATRPAATRSVTRPTTRK